MMMYGRHISLIDRVAELVAPGAPVVALRLSFVWCFCRCCCELREQECNTGTGTRGTRGYL